MLCVWFVRGGLKISEGYFKIVSDNCDNILLVLFQIFKHSLSRHTFCLISLPKDPKSYHALQRHFSAFLDSPRLQDCIENMVVWQEGLSLSLERPSEPQEN